MCCVGSDKPVFEVSTSTYTVSVLEHEPVRVNVAAVANPPTVSYSWYTGSLMDKFVSSGPQLALSTVTRHDAGSFVCIASNSEGSTTLPVILDVQCTSTNCFSLLVVIVFSQKQISNSLLSVKQRSGVG